MATTTQFPGKGFYYYQDHDPNGPVNNWAFEVLGLAVEVDLFTSIPPSEHAVCRPIFEPTDGSPREFDFWNYGAYRFAPERKEFRKITDKAVITELERIKKEMYQD